MRPKLFRSARPKAAQAIVALCCLGAAPLAGATPPSPPPETPAVVLRGASVPAPLVALMKRARGHDAELGVEEADLESARAARDTEAGALWPRLDARLGYTRNQHESIATFPDGAGTREVIITPRDALEAQVTVTVPLLELGRRGRLDASERRLEGRAAGVEAARLRTDEAVANAWFQGSFALSRIGIARAEVATAMDRVTRVEVRSQAGFASPLDRARAQAELENAKAVVADAELALARARLDLERLTGISASCEPGAAECPSFAAEPSPASPDAGSLQVETAPTVDDLPAVRAALAEAEALGREASAAELDLVPTVEAFVSERITNASGFGSGDNLSAGVTATFRLDLPSLGRDDELRARARAATRRAEVERRAAHVKILGLRREIAARQVALVAARAETAAREAAYEEAAARRSGGTATALDETTAQRDRLAARIEAARAEAELGLAQVLLALAAGEDLVAPRTTAGGSR